MVEARNISISNKAVKEVKLKMVPTACTVFEQMHLKGKQSKLRNRRNKANV